MDEDRRTEIAAISSIDIHPSSVMTGLSKKMIQSMLDRMGVEYADGMPKEAYLIAWHDAFCYDRNWIIRFLPGHYIDFLIEIWESDSMEMDSLRWDMVKNLKLFGLLAYKKGHIQPQDSGEIYVIESMKRHFYFFLKSRRNKKNRERLQGWEDVFLGLSYYYGICSFADMHKIFCQISKETVSYDELRRFISCRLELWGAGSIVRVSDGKEYFVNQNVENPDMILMYLDSHRNLDYKNLSRDDLLYVRQSYGIDNRWKGVSELGSYLVQDMQMSYYRSTVLIHTLILAIQNGSDLCQLRKTVDTMISQDTEAREELDSFLQLMYYHIPLYEYKGYSRAEYQKIQEETERKDRKNHFTIFQGGKL